MRSSREAGGERSAGACAYQAFVLSELLQTRSRKRMQAAAGASLVALFELGHPRDHCHYAAYDVRHACRPR